MTLHRWYWQQYAASAADLTNPDLAPLRSPLQRFVQIQEPALVQAAEEALAEIAAFLRDPH